MARTSNLANVATVSRATKAWYPGGWDFTNGGAITGDFVEYANNVARDGAQGLLVEESSTNEIRNPRAEGGNTSTLPTNWNLSGQAPTSYAYGTENGFPYVDLVYTAVTPSASTAIYFEANTQVAALDGEAFTTSYGVKLISGDLTNVNAINTRWVEYTSGGAVVTAVNTADFLSSIDGTHRRFAETRTMSGGGTTAFLKSGILLTHTSGAWTFTLRIYAPQLEKKAYPTSPILPPASSPAASDRNADDIDVGNGAWSNDDGPRTLYVEAQLVSNSSAQSGVIAGLGIDNNNRTSLNINAGKSQVFVNSGGATQFTSAPGSVRGENDVVRMAVAVDTDDGAFSADDITQQTDSALTIPAGNDKLTIGRAPSGGALLHGVYIKQVRYWPRRLTNAELEALVGN